MSHTGEKSHAWSEWDKAYSRNSQLASHMVGHTGQNGHGLNECGTVFPSKAHHTYHRRIHTGEKPYKCTQCGKDFNNEYQSYSSLENSHRRETRYMQWMWQSFSQIRNIVYIVWRLIRGKDQISVVNVTGFFKKIGLLKPLWLVILGRNHINVSSVTKFQ